MNASPINIAELNATQREYRAASACDSNTAASLARELRHMRGGTCRHCGALNTGRPHSWHAQTCPRFAR